MEWIWEGPLKRASTSASAVLCVDYCVLVELVELPHDKTSVCNLFHVLVNILGYWMYFPQSERQTTIWFPRGGRPSRVVGGLCKLNKQG